MKTKNCQPKRKKFKLPETEKTVDLSTPELQRLVLLKQLEYFEQAKKLIDMKLKREQNKQKEHELPAVPSATGSNELNVVPLSLFPGENNSLFELL